MPITARESTRPETTVSPYQGMNTSCTVSPWVVKSKDRPGLRPPASTTSRERAGDKDFSSCTQDLCGRPKARQNQGPSLVTQDTPIGNPGPFQAGGQAPPIHWVTDSQQGEFNGIPGLVFEEMPATRHTFLLHVYCPQPMTASHRDRIYIPNLYSMLVRPTY